MSQALEGVMGAIFLVVILAPLVGIWVLLNQVYGVEGPALCVMGLGLYGAIWSIGVALIVK